MPLLIYTLSLLSLFFPRPPISPLSLSPSSSPLPSLPPCLFPFPPPLLVLCNSPGSLSVLFLPQPRIFSPTPDFFPRCLFSPCTPASPKPLSWPVVYRRWCHTRRNSQYPACPRSSQYLRGYLRGQTRHRACLGQSRQGIDCGACDEKLVPGYDGGKLVPGYDGGKLVPGYERISSGVRAY